MLREPLSADAAAAVQRLALFNLTLALPSDDAGNGPDCLLRLPVVEGGRLRSGPLEPAPDATLPPGTAAWEAWSSGRRLLWTRSGGEPPPYPDWRSLLAGSEGGESVPAPAALLTVPIAAASIPAALGAATLALEWAPSAEELEELEGLCQCLARCISHHTKALWEVGADQFSRWGTACGLSRLPTCLPVYSRSTDTPHCCSSCFCPPHLHPSGVAWFPAPGLPPPGGPAHAVSRPKAGPTRRRCRAAAAPGCSACCGSCWTLGGGGGFAAWHSGLQRWRRRGSRGADKPAGQRQQGAGADAQP